MLVWTVVCLGVALLLSDEPRRFAQPPPAIFAFGVMSIVWALGVVGWMLARAVLL